MCTLQLLEALCVWPAGSRVGKGDVLSWCANKSSAATCSNAKCCIQYVWCCAAWSAAGKDAAVHAECFGFATVFTCFYNYLYSLACAVIFMYCGWEE